MTVACLSGPSKLYMPIPLDDGLWMVAYAFNGEIILVSEFHPGTLEDAEAVVSARNAEELAKMGPLELG